MLKAIILAIVALIIIWLLVSNIRVVPQARAYPSGVISFW